MKLTPPQLTNHLKNNFSSFYIISGDDLCLVEEAVIAVRRKAYEEDFTLREIIHVDANFDWQSFLISMQNLSLFSEKKLLEIHIAKFSETTQASLLKLAAIHQAILVRSAKLGKEILNAKWFQELEHQCVFVAVWPIEGKQLEQWVTQQLSAAKLHLDKDAIKLLIEFCEGNLLALKQEVEKLALCFAGEPTHITSIELKEMIAEHSRFNVFELANAVLLGDGTKVLKIFYQLIAEGVELTLILWGLTREIRKLAAIAHQLEQGEFADVVLQKQGVWDRHKAMVLKAVSRYSASGWRKLLMQASRIDNTIKSQAKINAQIELEQLALQITGFKIIETEI